MLQWPAEVEAAVALALEFGAGVVAGLDFVPAKH